IWKLLNPPKLLMIWGSQSVKPKTHNATPKYVNPKSHSRKSVSVRRSDVLCTTSRARRSDSNLSTSQVLSSGNNHLALVGTALNTSATAAATRTAGNPWRRKSHCQPFNPYPLTSRRAVDTGAPRTFDRGIAIMKEAVMRARVLLGNQYVKYRI